MMATKGVNSEETSDFIRILMVLTYLEHFSPLSPQIDLEKLSYTYVFMDNLML